ncbi:MAG: hypothetical protein AAF573_19200, partial [Bacteroidota bacterium]
GSLPRRSPKPSTKLCDSRCEPRRRGAGHRDARREENVLPIRESVTPENMKAYSDPIIEIIIDGTEH